MLAIDIVINLAKIMLILNGINITLSKANASNATSTIINASSSSSSSSRGHLQKSAVGQGESKTNAQGSLAAFMDFPNIRHERSKQRRHAITEQEEPQFSRKLYNTRPEKQETQLLYDSQPKAVTDPSNQHNPAYDEYNKPIVPTSQELNLDLKNFHAIKSPNINGDFANATKINVVSNATSNLNNAIDDKGNGNGNSISSITDMLEATAAATQQHLTAAVPAATSTSLKAVTHKIRKLHKKKIVESLRQLNIEKFNTSAGGGHWTKSHHRSLLEAEQLQQQQAQREKNTKKIVKTVGTDGEQIAAQLTQQQQQQEMTSIVSVAHANRSRHQAAKQSNKNDADVAADGIDTNESVNVGDLKNLFSKDETDDATTNDDDDDDGDDDDDDNDFAKKDDDDSLSDDFYQNDDSNANININEAVNDVDGLHATTVDSLLEDKFEKQFKNFSSEFLKDIDNNVDLDENDNDNENETVLVSWQQMKAEKSSYSNLTNSFKDLSANSATKSFPLNVSTATEVQTFSTASHAVEPSLAASTSKAISSATPNYSIFYKEDEMNFNDSSDLTQDDVSSSKDLIMDEAITDDERFSLSELNESDSDIDTETLGPFEVAGSDDETNHFLEGVVDAANSEEIYDWDEISRSNRRDLMHGRDVVTKFLQIVETQHSLGSNCEAGTSLNLGEGVVDRYAQDRFRVEAEVAVNRANMLTRIFKMTSAGAQADVNLLHASVLSMVEFDDDIFAAGNCFDWNEHPSQPGLFCPFAYRLPPPHLGAILAKDLAMEYHYLGNTSEWFFQARKNAEKVIARNEQYLKAFHLYSNKTDERIEDDTLAVKYEDGRWSKPYYDCGGGNIWMLTYTVPFFGYENSTYHFKGTSGIDIDLRRVDIDQCPQRHIPGSTKPLNIFAGTDKCKQRTTMCEAIQGLGFRRGSYKCVCRKGYYFPDTTSQHKYFNGSLLEEEYEKLMLGKNSTYNIVNEYECLPCAEGCESCEDGSPCIAALNWPMRTSILALACIVIGLLPPAAWFTFRYQQVKVVRAASPALLRVIALGAFCIYCTNIVMYPNPNLYTCTARIWLREIGFSLTYGALMLKTWRISVIFRVRSAKAVKITDAALLKRLGCICGAIGTCLLVRTLVSPPDVVVGRTADDLKAFLCKTDWWDYTFTSMEVVFLAWGVRLCIMVRKAPSEFNESRFISMAIYNEFLLTCFLNVSMLFLQSPANPDLLYIIFFCHTQLTITLLLALIFGSKVYIVLRSGKSHQENIGLGAKSSGAKFNFRPQVRTFANPSSVTTSTVPVAATTSAETKLSDQEALEEIRQLSMQLQRIQDMAPPKGVAVMTISSLLDGLKTPASVVVTSAAAPHAIVSDLHGNQLTVRAQKPEALPLLSLNTEMQKYQQLQVAQKSNTTTMMLTTTTNNNVAVVTSIPAATTLPSKQVTAREIAPLNTSITASGRWQEKAVNTEIVGNCRADNTLICQHQLHEHIICQRCYDQCKSQQHHENSTAKLDKCKILGSPQPEGSISFKNIKLDCMCSQSDDLDQLPEQESAQHSIRRITKRTAATNTPPRTTRKLAGHMPLIQPAKEVKALSSVSLPSDECHNEISQQSSSRKQQQICDNCRKRFKRKGSLGKTKKLGSNQHRKLSRLSSRCNILLADIENSKGLRIATKPNISHKTGTKTTMTTTTTTTTTEQHKKHDREEEPQYSTDDIIFYTTSDSSDSYEDDDDSDDDDGDDETEDGEAAHRENDLSSTLAQSKSETRVLQKLKPHLAAIDLKCISLSMGNITTTSTTSSSSQPETIKSKTALLEANTTTIQVTTTAMDPSTTSEQPATQTPLPPPPPPPSSAAASAASASAANGSNNGKAKRPDKLVLNLNDRSKFTKEVSV